MGRHIVIDPYRCTGCDECRKACAEGHARAGSQSTPRLSLLEGEQNAALACHHCEGAPCLKVCPTQAIVKHEDGCIRVDEHRCVGCKLCACACPFGAVRMGGTGIAGVAGIAYPHPVHPEELHPLLRWQIGVSSVAVKCDLCVYDGCRPHCVAACLTGALRLVEAADARGEAFERRVRSAREILSDFAEEEGSGVR